MQSHRLSVEDMIAEQRAEAVEGASATPDPYGVPSNMFGPVPEEFYGLVGRITMIWPVVDKELHWLHDTITGAAQDVAAGLPFAQLADRCERASRRGSAELRAIVAPAIASVRRTADDRNAIVHSLWPDPTLTRAVGHRPVRPRQRPPGSSEWSIGVQVSEADLRALIASEVAAADILESARLQVGALPAEQRRLAPVAKSDSIQLHMKVTEDQAWWVIDHLNAWIARQPVNSQADAHAFVSELTRAAMQADRST